MGQCQSGSADQQTDEAPKFDEKKWKKANEECLKKIMEGEGFKHFKQYLNEELKVRNQPSTHGLRCFARQNNGHQQCFILCNICGISCLQVKHLDFYEQVEQLKQAKKDGETGEMEVKEQAKQVFENFLKSDSGTVPTQFAKSTEIDDEDDPVKVLEDAQDEVYKLLIVEYLLRFLLSTHCTRMKEELDDSKLNESIDKAVEVAPKNRAEWLKTFRIVADSIPSCVVISDYRKDDIPMVFVNKAFCTVTKYKQNEAEGKNCRFLQGPDTDPESVKVLKECLSDQKEQHVNILNYKKDGEKFNNLLSLKPVFGMDGKCEYFLGVQYEVDDVSSMMTRLLQHEQLLKMLPSNMFLVDRSSNVSSMMAGLLQHEQVQKLTGGSGQQQKGDDQEQQQQGDDQEQQQQGDDQQQQEGQEDQGN